MSIYSFQVCLQQKQLTKMTNGQYFRFKTVQQLQNLTISSKSLNKCSKCETS